MNKSLRTNRLFAGTLIMLAALAGLTLATAGALAADQPGGSAESKAAQVGAVGEHAAEAMKESTHPNTGEPKDAAGEPGAQHEPGLVDINKGELLFTVIIFVALLIVLRFTAWKPILQGLKDRETAIRDGIEAAQKARDEAARTARELEARIAEAQRAGAQEVARAKADAQKLAEGIRAQAEAEASALKDRTLRDIDAAKQQAIADINTHAAELGTAVARRILQREVKVDDQQRLVEESLKQLGTSKIS